MFRIDPNRSADAAKRLLAERIEGLLVTDAYAAYNSIHLHPSPVIQVPKLKETFLHLPDCG